MAAELSVLYRYLSSTSSEALSGAFEAVDSATTSVRPRNINDRNRGDYIIELIYQFLTHLITLHLSQKQPYKPLLVRHRLESMIHTFPQNSLFLSTYADIFKHQAQLDDKIRRTIRWPVFAEPEETNLAAWSVTICHEIGRYEAQAGSTAENVRALFQRALFGLGSPVSQAPRLWWLWYRFEEDVLGKMLAQRELFAGSKHAARQVVKQSGRLRQVFLDGLRVLPWLKAWVLAGLKTFDGGRDDDLSWDLRELRSVYDVLHERELRVRTEGVENFVEDLMTIAARRERE